MKYNRASLYIGQIIIILIINILQSTIIIQSKNSEKHNGLGKVSTKEPIVLKLSKDTTMTHNVGFNPGNLLPGVQLLSFGVNILKSQPVYDEGKGLSNKQAFKFTYDDKKTTSGDGQYLEPDQVSVIWWPTCSIQSNYSSVVSLYSTKSLKQQSSSFDIGYEQKADIGIEAGGVSASTTIENSLKYGNSKQSRDENSQMEASKSTRSSSTKIAKLGEYKIDEMFISKLYNQNKDFKKLYNACRSGDKNKILKFIQYQGTHIITKADMGAKLEMTYQFDKKDSKSKVSNFLKEQDGFSASFAGLSVSKTSKTSKLDTKNMFSGSSQQKLQVTSNGKVNTESTPCGGFSGSINQPIPQHYNLKAQWQLFPKSKAAKNILSFVNEIMNQMFVTTFKKLKNKGVPIINRGLFDNVPTNINKIEDLFSENIVMCNEGFHGQKCEEETGPLTQSGTIKFNVLRADNLIVGDTWSGDPYLKIQKPDGGICKSPVVSSTNNPQFNFNCDFKIKGKTVSDIEKMTAFTITIYDSDDYTDDFLGMQEDMYQKDAIYGKVDLVQRRKINLANKYKQYSGKMKGTFNQDVKFERDDD